MKHKLTTKDIENAKPRLREYKLSDGDGLFIRVRTTGAKSYLYCFRLRGSRKTLSMTIDSCEDMSLTEARNKLEKLRRQVKAGIDPRSARAAEIAENTQAITMQKLFDDWCDFLKTTKQVSPDWIKRHEDRWRLHLKKHLGNLLAKDITRAHLATALDIMTRKGIKEETRKALTTFNLMLDYGLTRHAVDNNPARLLKPKDFAATANQPRDRVLTIAELRMLWQALDQAIIPETGIATTSTLSIVTATAIKLLILTGARRSEIAGMRWSELCFKENIWELPPERTKNNQRHVIYFPDLAITLLKILEPLNGQSEFVFNMGQSHIHKDTLTKAITRLRTASLSPLQGIKSFSCHDLRRSAATAWGEHLKTDPHIIERMLNHQPLNKLIATYQKATYAKEQKKAWLSWGNLVEYQIANEPTNIVMIKNINSLIKG